MGDTSIQWTDKVWNPTTGCDKVSPGCAHCYAETIAKRLWPTSYPPVEYTFHDPTISAEVTDMRPRQFTDVQTHEARLLEPLSWRKPSRVFVNSMSDLFHEDVPDAFIDQVFAVMALAERHTFQILTKRPARMREYFDKLEFEPERIVDAAVEVGDSPCASGAVEDRGWPLPNVWLGVSVENQHFADERIPLLLQTPAAVRFISAEPLLGPVELQKLGLNRHFADCACLDCTTGSRLGYLDWVIVGGESGPGARPFDLAWARSIVQQCKAAGVPVFVKQLGAKPIEEFAPRCDSFISLKDRKGGDMAEWPADLQVRQFPEVRA